MRTTGKFLRFAIVIICLGFVVLLAREGEFPSAWKDLQGLFPGKKEHKLTFVDYEFKPVIRKDLSKSFSYWYRDFKDRGRGENWRAYFWAVGKAYG